jgi:hypothetical protein
MTAINEKLLEDRLGTLEAARSWSPRVVSRLEALIRSGEDDALFRVNPIKFASDKGGPRRRPSISSFTPPPTGCSR